DDVRDRMGRVARRDPQRRRLAAPPVLLARVRVRELLVRSRYRAGMLERLALPFLTEDLPDHAASASTTDRTQAEFSRATRRRARRSAVFGPWPVTTCMSSSQSGSV